MLEEWRDVVGYEDYFMVSEMGRIFSKRSNREISLSISKAGYKQFATRFGGRKGTAKLFRVHVVVCEAFNGPRPNNEQRFALHWDDDKLNNHHTNLRWGSLQENRKDAIRNGRITGKIPQQDNESNCKLSAQDVEFIKDNFKAWDRIFGARALSRKFDIDKNAILRIIAGTSYKHLCPS